LNYAKGIRIVRTVKGWDQKDLAVRIGVDASYVSLLETGKRIPTLPTLESIASTSNISMRLLTAISESNLDGYSEALLTALDRELFDFLFSPVEK